MKNDDNMKLVEIESVEYEPIEFEPIETENEIKQIQDGTKPSNENNLSLFRRSKLLLVNRINDFNPFDYNIIFMGNSWVGNGSTGEAIFERAYQTAINYNPVMILHGGDTVYTGDRDRLQYFVDKMEYLYNNYGERIPIFVVLGNHERDGKIGGIENYREIIGELNFTLDIRRLSLTIIGLNNVYNEENERDINFGFTEKELNYLKEKLKKRRLTTIVAMHVPPREGKFASKVDHTFTKGKNEFIKAIRNRVSSVLVSHMHSVYSDNIYNTKFVLSGGAGAALEKDQMNHMVVINVKHGKMSFTKVTI